MKFDQKNLKTYFESLIFPSFIELYCSPIVYINRMEPMFQELSFVAPKRSQKITMNLVTFVTGVEPTSWCLLRPCSTFCSVHPDGSKKCFVPNRDHGRRVKSVANREEMCKDAYSRAAGF